ncbi:ABC transporter transmembrane domain-containing protein [Mycoplasmoides gallisepticum]|uniref:ABC transporter transmembrane domain-containing protein n=1 Tax=Mycoplasmoides gallisepticum TaxID=2096 RepID=UPI001EFF3740|nr:ABC transporter transmembrane domain-containing protein [Mycoplasmoides gallisepticum]
MLGVAALGFTFGYLGGRSIIIASVEFAKQLRVNIFERYQSFSVKNTDKFEKASVLTRMTTDINFIQQSIQSGRTAIRGMSVFLFSLVLMFVTSWKLGIASVAIMPVIIGGILLVYRFVIGNYKKLFKQYDQLNNLAK